MNTRMPAYAQGLPPTPSTIHKTNTYVGQTIEDRVAKILNNKEPITDGAPQIFTERSEGVKPEHNIRTDRFELALDMTVQINENRTKDRKARQEARTKANSQETTPGTPTQGNNPTGEPAK